MCALNSEKFPLFTALKKDLLSIDTRLKINCRNGCQSCVLFNPTLCPFKEVLLGFVTNRVESKGIHFINITRKKVHKGTIYMITKILKTK